MKRHQQKCYRLVGFVTACAFYLATAAEAEPIVLRANAVPEAGNAIRPLLPPDTEIVKEGNIAEQQAEASNASSFPDSRGTSPEPADQPLVQDSASAPAKQQGIGIQLSHQPGIDSISLSTGLRQPKFTIQELQKPHRLVVDVEGAASRASRSMKTQELDFVSGIRVGSHPNRSRIVLDLSEEGTIEHSAVVEKGAILVTLRSSNASPAVAGMIQQDEIDSQTEKSLVEQRIDEAVAESKDTGRSFEAPEDSEALDIDGDKGQQVAQVNDNDVKVERVSLSESSGVKGVRITKLALADATGNSPQVRVSYLGKPDFQLQRTAPSEYVLTIRKAALDKAVDKKPLFASSNSSSIRSARTTVDGKNVLVRVFSQPSTYLTAREEKGSIIISETQDLTQVVKDIRAQLSPPGDSGEPQGSTIEKDSSKSQQSSPTAPVLPAVEDNSKKDVAATQVSAADKAAPKKSAASRAKGRTTVTEISDADIDALLGDKSKYTGKLISLDLQETDIDNALRIIAEVSNLNIVASEDVKGKVTLRLLDVPWDQALDVILKTNGLDKVVEGSVMRIAPVDKLKVERESLKEARDAEEELEPLSVKYLRVSYAKAAEIKSIVETVLSERGSVAYDERSNQLIVKDVRAGLKNVVELVSKVDLRTPQVLLETQIVESSRNLARDLGSQLGFQYIQSPSTGNGLGNNFPSSFAAGGSVDSSSLLGSSFPAPVSLAGGSAVSMLFDSADGTKSLELRLSQLEQEGRVRIISRPAVATTNNKAAEIKSVEKYRVRLPNGGVSVATGSGASASGTSSTATEVIEAGITLNVTPQASPDYYILLDIKARSSTFGNTARFGDANIPNEFERSASSTVLVSSGQTFALGGIYKVTESDQVAGVPFFKDLPVLGTFFRRTNTSDSDEELLFFITPRIVEGSFDNASVKSIS